MDTLKDPDNLESPFESGESPWAVWENIEAVKPQPLVGAQSR